MVRGGSQTYATFSLFIYLFIVKCMHILQTKHYINEELSSEVLFFSYACH